ncbi:MAG: hypothetical protein IJ705_05000 [Oscillospiraceae bacterium]|nr:hypothetical protein [Oscillospiraceae bacterium]
MSYFWSQLVRSVGMFSRAIRAFFQRLIVGAIASIRRVFNITRYAARAATTSLQSALAIAQKPTKREDYVETRRLFISKSLLLKVALILIAVGLVAYFLVWPFILSHFLTARFHVEDRRVENWTGRVIVYSDKQKTVPIYAGKLEEGVLQGDGQEYDDQGRIAYEGQFVNGVRNGSGVAYADGIKIYEGQFADGIYEGSGRLFEDGLLAYEGQFSAGIYEGRGALYDKGTLIYSGQFSEGIYAGQGTLYEDGDKVYEGNFKEGLPSGSGTSYRGGNKSYEGQFEEGLRSGTGKAYDETGRLTYDGGWAAGSYSGQGILYPVPGQQLEASFTEGEPDGSVRWSKHGKLYYEGDWSGNAPFGFGVLYNQAKKTIYAGQFAGGTLDGEWLLSLGVDDYRSALGEGQVKTAENPEGGFLISAPELGLTALCSYQTVAEDSRIYSVELGAPADANWVCLLPDTGHISPVNAELMHTGQKISALKWTAEGDAPSKLDLGGASKADQQMDRLLAAVGRVGGGGAAGAVSPSDGYMDPGPALAQCSSPEQAAELVDAMLLYWQQAERRAALGENLTRVETMLETAQADAAKGTDNEELLYSLTERKEKLEAEIQLCQTQQKKAELQATGDGVDALGQYALSGMLVYFNPGYADVSNLALTAIAYAQATGADANTAKLEARTKALLVELIEQYGQAEYARSRYDAASQHSQNAAAAYATGSSPVESWYEALSEQADARSDLTGVLAEFSRKANELNLLTGGWVSRNYNWKMEEFDEVFSAALPEPPGEEAEATDADASAEAATEEGEKNG